MVTGVLSDGWRIRLDDESEVGMIADLSSCLIPLSH
ncbi:hypothetical protein SAMN05216325_11883 [Nitrosomonas marina]|uniref:Uncharacterized protein n=1 Tax=Nitrosomonas marina TaxID=917 RepID=A0A1H8GLF0_9PROT|nr:hypothetical protein SAMN05216325_11883 [Nitrosomonas marina]